MRRTTLAVQTTDLPLRGINEVPAGARNHERSRAFDARRHAAESANRRPAIRENHSVNQRVLLRDRRYRRSLVVADAVAALLALLLTAGLNDGLHVQPSVLLGLPVVILASKLTGLYDRDELLIRKTTFDEAPKLFQLATLYTLLIGMLGHLVLGARPSTAGAGILWASLWGLGITARRIARFSATQSVPAERLLVIGDALTYRRIEDKLAMGGTHTQLVGRMSLQRITGSEERAIDRDTMRELTRDLDVDRVMIAPSQSNPEVTADLVRAAKAAGVRVSIVPHVFDVVGNSVVFDDLHGMTVLGVREFALSRSSHTLKRAFDLAGAGILLLAAAPAMALIALAIKLDSRGPVLFRQERVGKAGRRFRICKFRTMVPDAEERKADLMAHNEANGLFKIAEDPRITRVGRLLRKTSLDELPQLFNVLWGEMSLVGPRPLILAEDETIKGYDRRRLRLTPGMTGHWQIMGSSRVPMPEMLKIDYVYVTTWSLFNDMKILVRTIPYMLARKGM
jgi:exopolysaccharide biosynthesis polyprenyl glycosylphosphotransferase